MRWIPWRFSVPFALAAALLPVGLDAQAVLQPGARSLAFTLPTSESMQYGIWRAYSARTNLGLNFVIEMTDRVVERPNQSDSETSSWTLAFGPSVKYYIGDRPVAPHIRGDAFVGFGRDRPSEGRSDRTTLLGLAAALGADWYPVQRMSLGGHTGVELDYSRRSERGPGLDRTTRVLRFGTFTSGIHMQLYF